MHSEWAANMEQTTSMTHETALQNRQSSIVKRYVLTDKTRAILKDDVATWPNITHCIYGNKLVSEGMTEYLGVNVSRARRAAWEARQSTRTTTRWAHKGGLRMRAGGGPSRRNTGGGEGGWVGDPLSGRASKASIHWHSIWGIKAHFTEQMEEGQPDRHLIPSEAPRWIIAPLRKASMPL